LIILFCIIALSGITAAPVSAEIVPGRHSVSPFIGWYSFDHDLQLKDKPVYGLRLGYDFTERWGVEGAFDYVPTKSKVASGDVKAYGARLDALYHFRYKESLVPFLAAGLGGTMIDYPWGIKENGNHFLFDYGGGLKYFLSDDWALRADIRHLLVFNGGRQDWEFTLGLSWLFGGMRTAPPPPAVVDSDGDGVPDDLDKCPDTPKGTKVDKNGCPVITDRDSDGDGVWDSLDKCPDTPKGVKVDKDGCPLVIEGDRDGDGVPDSLDKCPDTPKGVSVDKNGCPLDSDGDGVPDYLDKCPDTPKGVTVDKDGCPLPKKVSISLSIEFDSGKATIKPQYDEEIKKVADFMTTYPETTAVIEGHTDNVGKEASNVRLSTRRAESVKAYLVEKFGIASARLTAKGFGSSQPVADNATPAGRQKNRRINAVIETMTKQ
jgi:OOP family OmpA-OmpF porin